MLRSAPSIHRIAFRVLRLYYAPPERLPGGASSATNWAVASTYIGEHKKNGRDLPHDVAARCTAEGHRARLQSTISMRRRVIPRCRRVAAWSYHSVVIEDRQAQRVGPRRCVRAVRWLPRNLLFASDTLAAPTALLVAPAGTARKQAQTLCRVLKQCL